MASHRPNVIDRKSRALSPVQTSGLLPPPSMLHRLELTASSAVYCAPAASLPSALRTAACIIADFSQQTALSTTDADHDGDLIDTHCRSLDKLLFPSPVSACPSSRIPDRATCVVRMSLHGPASNGNWSSAPSSARLTCSACCDCPCKNFALDADARWKT